MSNSIEQSLTASRRLEVLKILLAVRITVPDAAMMHALHTSSHRVLVDRAAVRADYKYLEEVMCVTTELLDDRVLEATITARGALVAQGNLKVDGVADALLER